MKYIFLLTLVISPAIGFSQSVFDEQKAFYNAMKANDLEKAERHALFFENLSVQDLQISLNTEAKKKAFWVNFYNIYVQYLLVRKPELFEDRDSFFKSDYIRIAGHTCSFDLIEHGIIRRSKNKYSLGYFGKVFVDDFEEVFRLEEVDYRVHFALNCGAKSCPPVSFYNYEKLDEQLDQASQNYLKEHVRYESESNDVYVPILAFWFNADFGGNDGIRDMLEKYGFQEILENEPGIEYLEYDWTLLTDNYVELTTGN